MVFLSLKIVKKTKILAASILILMLLVFSVFTFVLSAPLPSFVIPCRVTDYGSAWEGGFAYGLFQYDPSDLSLWVASYLIVMNSRLDLLHLREWYGSSYLGSVNAVASNTLLFQGEGDTEVHFWNFTSGNTTDFQGVSGHHDVEYNPSNNTFLTLNKYVREVNGTSYLFDKIVEYNSNGTVLWAWDTYDHIPLSEQSVYNITTVFNGQTVVDFTHANSLDWDYNSSIIYLNCRHTNTFYKINKNTGDIIWSCGEFGNFTLLDAEGNHVKNLWFGCHDVKQVEPNVFAMFNNDFGNITNFNDDHSAMQEVTLNLQNMTAWVSWSWTAPKELYSAYWGETARLPNGDRIGVFGTPNHPAPISSNYLVNYTGAVLVEVNPQGEVVRLYEFPHGWGIYRVEPLSLEVTPSNSPSTTPQSTQPTSSPTPTLESSPSSNVSPTPSQLQNNWLLVIVMVAAVAAIVLSISAILFCRKRRKS
jgi:hypothetical protein